MRRILIDHARRHAAAAGEAALRLEDVQVGTATDPDVMLSIDRALEELAALDARQAQIVELRFFGGFSVEETAGLMEISAKTVKRDWALARAWLEQRVTR
jgi:RNA polymerase sigma factor (TIGR02999 family)